jgi:hypothetical protein
MYGFPIFPASRCDDPGCAAVADLPIRYRRISR